MKKVNSIQIVVLFMLSCVFAAPVKAKEIHVSKTGSDSNAGTETMPLLSISKAAEIADAGDIITVHAGTYREWVKPARGGNSEEQRITYQAAKGEEVFVKGSEQITGWNPLGEGVWKVELPNSFFGNYNPYALCVNEKYMTYGQWHHRGDVFLNGTGFYEKQTIGEVKLWKNRWHCEVNEYTTTIWANFEKSDPNKELVEINVRESIFFPEIMILK